MKIFSIQITQVIKCYNFYFTVLFYCEFLSMVWNLNPLHSGCNPLILISIAQESDYYPQYLWTETKEM